MSVSRTPGSPADESEPTRFVRELGLTHAEFFRFLPPAIGNLPFNTDNNVVRIADGHRTVTIDLGPQRHRSIASLRMPYLEATFTFTGFTASERQAFMARFERYFQRGGG